jgi:hypothetical protein
MPREGKREGLGMSGVRAITKSAEAQLPAEGHQPLDRDGGKEKPSRRPRPSKPAQETSGTETHKLNVEA